jgi:hypothetical protein
MLHWSHLFKGLYAHLGKFWLGAAFLLVAGLSFEAGMLQSSLKEVAPLVVEVPNVLPASVLPERTVSLQAQPTAGSTNVPESANGCAFVGSKKSNKYHRPSSRCAKQIKSENRLCFASLDAATAKGYLPGCLE